MRIRTILAAAAAPAALAAVLLGTAGQASAATTASSSDASAYYWNPNGHALGGPQGIGLVSSDSASTSGPQVTFGSQYLAKVTEKTNNANIYGQTITITGHLNQSAVTYQGQGSDGITSPRIDARVYFIGTGGSDGSPTQLGFYSQNWWADASSAVLDLTPSSQYQGQDFKLTITVDPSAGWSDWDGQVANGNTTDSTLFQKAASHVREVGLSFGGGSFFENGVTGQGGLTINSIQVQ